MKKLLYKFNRWLGWSGLPIACIYNDVGTEKYILTNCMNVIVKSTDKNADGYNIIPLIYASERLVEDFTKELNIKE